MAKEIADPQPKSKGKGSVEQILKAASDLFGRDGFDGASSDDIALAVGISKPTLYKRFSSKLDILQAISEKHHRELNAKARSIADGEGPAAEKLETLFRTHVRYTVERRVDFQVLNSEKRRLPDRRAINRYADEYMQLLRDLIAASLGQDASPQDIEIVARSFIALANWPGFWFRPQSGELSLQKLIDGAWTLFAGGYQAAAAANPAAPDRSRS